APCTYPGQQCKSDDECCHGTCKTAFIGRICMR
uniref:U21-ctenitoxin-Co1a n=1 Tax=Ctenus ornatus TaxID=406443 RepID=F256_CTEON|nr:RecName: Full=U21-ctenitoxin-Co1a; Short=U21-CNTX-Co1a; AltName: Full=Venom peptide Oct F25-6 [Oligoctenus ornatus]